MAHALSLREQAEVILNSRSRLIADLPARPRSPDAAEGGCGVLGLAANVPILGRHVITASQQMHNRGNGKGGGIAAAGLDPAQLGVSPQVLRSNYLIQVAYLDPQARVEVERECLLGRFDIAGAKPVETVDDHRSIPGLEVHPPDVVRYFCQIKPEVLARFAEENGLRHLPARQVEDEYVYQNSFRLNQRYYSSLGDKRAFVLCHGRDLLAFKIVGYAEQAIAYYRLDELAAHVWITHQRYPTKGRIWHPGGAHPFIGVNEALVHNGDFANYHRVTEYLRQRNIVPLFLTDTEVSVLLFDLWDRVYGYPLEVLLEALAPTTERDFDMLPPEKQALYRCIQQAHLHGSPDGPWFFIIARSQPDLQSWQLLGITDTSMLRPQVFALYESQDGAQIGLIASERQAINACLRSLSQEDTRFQPLADKYWMARGGSYNDGGAFILTVTKNERGCRLTCQDKFGLPITMPQPACPAELQGQADETRLLASSVGETLGQDAGLWFEQARARLTNLSLPACQTWLDGLVRFASQGDRPRTHVIAILTLLRDRRYDTGPKKRSALLALVDRTLYQILRALPRLDDACESAYRCVGWASRQALRPPRPAEQILVVDACGFSAEGPDSAAQLLRQAYEQGWPRLLTFDWRGGRFAGCGLGAGTAGLCMDIYGDCGDYLASGLDGAQVTLHGDAQDQVGQILKSGRLVIHGDVGQTFLYGAKGGEVYVLGSAAGRPLINAVGRPRVVINGTCLDYLAESFMAGDPLQGGGFAILNGMTFDDAGRLVGLPTPYPGGNLFSLASGGAIYLRDPHLKVDPDQLNGGQFAPLSEADWHLIEPYLRQNEVLFGIPLEQLLRVDGVMQPPERVYRKVEVSSLDILHEVPPGISRTPAV
jgi:glutamate synthase domain-containing protein 1/glutamate synthase domain-containing protein 3